uniref:chloride channel protein n=1 Tax=Klebsiella pneumoniae TaxID=573 RepID=UPI0031FBC454
IFITRIFTTLLCFGSGAPGGIFAPMLALGTLFFIVGLLGFMVAGQAIWLWLAAMAVFTLGEIIVIPVEY